MFLKQLELSFTQKIETQCVNDINEIIGWQKISSSQKVRGTTHPKTIDQQVRDANFLTSL
jgi:hypothetical protein